MTVHSPNSSNSSNSSQSLTLHDTLHTQKQAKLQKHSHSTSTFNHHLPTNTESNCNLVVQSRVFQTIEELQSGTMEKCAELYMNLQADLRDNDSDNLLGQDLILHLSPLVDILIRDIRLALKPGSSRSSSLVSSVLRCVGFFLHHDQIIKALGDKQTFELLSLVCHVILQTDDKMICCLAVWCLTSQRLPSRATSQHSLIIAQSIAFALDGPFESDAIRVEALNALIVYCKVDPISICAHANEWVSKVLFLTVHSMLNIRDKASHILGLITLKNSIPETVHQRVANEFLKANVDSYFEHLLKLECKEKYLLRLWANLVLFFGRWLWNSIMLTNLCKIIEKCFNSSSVDVRKFSCQAWEKLVTALISHFLSEKCVNLLMGPVCTLLKAENSRIVRDACVKLWLKILYSLESNLPSYFEITAKPILSVLANDECAETHRVVSILVNFMFSYESLKLDDSVKLSKILTTVHAIRFKNLDTKWKRRNCDLFCQFFNDAIRKNHKESIIILLKTWDGFLVTLNEANKLEIQHTQESILATKQCINLFRGICIDLKNELDGNEIVNYMAASFLKYLGPRISMTSVYVENEEGSPRNLLDVVITSLFKRDNPPDSPSLFSSCQTDDQILCLLELHLQNLKLCTYKASVILQIWNDLVGIYVDQVKTKPGSVISWGKESILGLHENFVFILLSIRDVQQQQDQDLTHLEAWRNYILAQMCVYRMDNHDHNIFASSIGNIFESILEPSEIDAASLFLFSKLVLVLFESVFEDKKLMNAETTPSKHATKTWDLSSMYFIISILYEKLYTCDFKEKVLIFDCLEILTKLACSKKLIAYTPLLLSPSFISSLRNWITDPEGKLNSETEEVVCVLWKSLGDLIELHHPSDEITGIYLRLGLSCPYSTTILSKSLKLCDTLHFRSKNCGTSLSSLYKQAKRTLKKDKASRRSLSNVSPVDDIDSSPDVPIVANMMIENNDVLIDETATCTMEKEKEKTPGRQVLGDLLLVQQPLKSSPGFRSPPSSILKRRSVNDPPPSSVKRRVTFEGISSSSGFEDSVVPVLPVSLDDKENQKPEMENGNSKVLISQGMEHSMVFECREPENIRFHLEQISKLIESKKSEMTTEELKLTQTSLHALMTGVMQEIFKRCH